MAQKQQIMKNTRSNAMTSPILKRYDEIESPEVSYLLTGIEKFDNFYSNEGGISWGSMNFVTGSSGAGKTTGLVELQTLIKAYKSALYQRESLGGQVRDRNKNQNFHDNCYITDGNLCPNLDMFMEEVDRMEVKILIIDSLQVVADDFMERFKGNEDKCIKHVYMSLLKWVQRTGGIVFLIGHVTKDDTFAGKNGIMQMMDAHLEFIYDEKNGENFCRFGQKNRLGQKGDGNRLFYQFKGDSNGIEFFTENEWRVIHQRKSFTEFLAPKMKDYVDAFKDKDGFKEFKAELRKKEREVLNDDNVSVHQMLGIMFTFVSELVEKYGFLK